MRLEFFSPPQVGVTQCQGGESLRADLKEREELYRVVLVPPSSQKFRSRHDDPKDYLFYRTFSILYP